MDGEALMRSAVLINPKAGRGNGKGLALAEALKAYSHVDVCVMQNFDDLIPALKRFAVAETSDLFISSGDGTVQAILTFIAESKAFKTLPRLCLLPHGTTNLTAADIGFTRKSISVQAAFIANPRATSTTERATLRILNPRDGAIRHGMFLGTGAVTEATRYAQVAFNDKGVKGNSAVFFTLAGALMKTLFSKANPHDPNRFDRPFPIRVQIGDHLMCNGVQLLAMATTLDKLILGTRPFWGGRTGPIRVTTFPYPVPNLLRWFLPSVMGGEMRTPPPGAKSAAVSAFSIETPIDYDLDGEFFAGPSGEALRVEAGPVFTYLLA
jgi:diacylglycerol kinase (ATP)